MEDGITLTPAGVAATIALAMLLVGGSCYLQPKYRVYSARMAGEAIRAKAEGSRQQIVSQAQAERDAAVLRAEAIGIVGKAAHDFPEYRQQEFVGAFANALEHCPINQVLYVPTEANIPITEAGKRPQPEKGQ